jgi:hypothetical protein
MCTTLDRTSLISCLCFYCRFVRFARTCHIVEYHSLLDRLDQAPANVSDDVASAPIADVALPATEWRRNSAQRAAQLQYLSLKKILAAAIASTPPFNEMPTKSSL